MGTPDLCVQFKYDHRNITEQLNMGAAAIPTSMLQLILQLVLHFVCAASGFILDRPLMESIVETGITNLEIWVMDDYMGGLYAQSAGLKLSGAVMRRTRMCQCPQSHVRRFYVLREGISDAAVEFVLRLPLQVPTGTLQTPAL